MVAQPWLLKMGSQVSSNLKKPTKNQREIRSKTLETIGILSFEVANLMSKTIRLHKSLTNSEISKLKSEILSSEGVKTLVSSDKTYLLDLMLSEKLDDLTFIAGVVSRLGKKSTIPQLQGFHHVYSDIASGAIDVRELGFLVKDMDAMVRKMERYVSSTATLYGEMEALNELEAATKKFQQNQHEASRKILEQKLVWQKQDVKHMKDVSLWNQTFDKIVAILARTVCTIYARICIVFSDSISRREMFLSSSVLVSNSRKTDQIRPQIRSRNPETNLFKSEEFNSACGSGPGRLFMECLSMSTSGSKPNDSEDDQSSQISGSCSVSGLNRSGFRKGQKGNFTTSGLPARAAPTTVGGSALALHYANVVIVIEKLLNYPHLVGEEARDDLYRMLPSSLKSALKRSLKSYAKGLSIYDAPLAHDWKDRLDRMLAWLGPLARNMVRWQSERNFEGQMVPRTNVLLLQTLYFADQAKTEAAICELLVGLNYICRYEHQRHALLDCASSFDLDEWSQY